MNDTAIAMACEGLGKALNRALEFDPQTPQKLGELTGKSLLIESTAPHFCVCLLFTDAQLIIVPSDECSGPSMLSGTAPALLHFLLAGDVEAAEKCQIELSDEHQLIPALLSLSRKIDIDWEALLAEHTGDVAAHLVGGLLRNAQQFKRDISDRSKKGWATFSTDNQANQQGHNKPQSPLDIISAQLKTLLP